MSEKTSGKLKIESEKSILPLPLGEVSAKLTEREYTTFDSMCRLSNIRKKLFAFTLAEVLITLGIIGIVSAITMSTLIKNYQKTVWTNQLKKTYSTLNQALLKYLADEGVTTFNNSDVRKFDILKKYLVTTDIKKLENYKYTFLNDNTEQLDFIGKNVMFLADGSILLSVSDINRYLFDINGLKGPNKYGRDIFIFMLYSDRLYPLGSKELSRLWGINTGSRTYLREWEHGTNNYNCKNKVGNGYGCAGRIFEKGKMDY